MKTFELKETEIKSGDKFLTYKDLILACLAHLPEGGFSRQDHRDRDRIEDVLETESSTLKFEDADAENLKSVVDKMKWGMRNKDVSHFLDAIEQM